jgi:hypothetical protein
MHGWIDPYGGREDVVIAAGEALAHLAARGGDLNVDDHAKMLVLQAAFSFPTASIGTCHCGLDLRFEHRSPAQGGGLFVCCNTPHCIQIA